MRLIVVCCWKHVEVTKMHPVAHAHLGILCQVLGEELKSAIKKIPSTGWEPAVPPKSGATVVQS